MEEKVVQCNSRNTQSRMINDFDIYLFHEGTHFELANTLGARPVFNSTGQIDGYYFAVWAPNAKSVSVVGNWNNWQHGVHPMTPVSDSGIWETYLDGVGVGWTYKFSVETPSGAIQYKADPFARFAELRPQTASRTWQDQYKWHDSVYRIKHAKAADVNEPMVIYEVHLGSWLRGKNGEMLSYRELADKLSRYAADNGYTHIELMPIAEHPYDGSWGYQITGYFAPTSRYGTPEDFKYFVDTMHSRQIGVIMDWVPAHFPRDEQGLRSFDGTALYEHSGWQADQKQWGTLRFDLGKREVRSFLISNALYWLDEFHIDGLRVDAVSCMLYLDYGKQDGEWQPNMFGGREDLEAIDFLKTLNREVYKRFPGALMIAEEASDFEGVTAPLEQGGLGFTYKWNMGWMNDTLKYMSMDPYFRRDHHGLMTFSMMYAFKENYVLPISHDENVHGKKTLLDRMSGDYWQKFSNLKAYLSFMFTHPGKKLLFMGSEYGQFMEWRYYESLEWEMLRYETHRGLYMFVRELIALYKKEPALWQMDDSWDGFEWSNPDDAACSVLSYVRKGAEAGELLVIAVNFTPVERFDYWIGVPEEGEYELILNSEDKRFGGGGYHPEPVLKTDSMPQPMNLDYRLRATLPPLSAVIYKYRTK